MIIAAGSGNGIDGPWRRLREASQSHAFDSPLPGEGEGGGMNDAALILGGLIQ
jgi:hypothetical protein